MIAFSEPIPYKDFSIRIGRLEHLFFAQFARHDGKGFVAGGVVATVRNTDTCYGSEREALDAAKQLIDAARRFP